MFKSLKIFPVILFLISVLLTAQSGFTCTRVLKADNPQAILVGRNMDWMEDMQANLWVYPAGLMHEGLIKGNALKWISKYGSMVATVYDDIKPIVSDGMNERGLAAHLLSLPEADYGVRDETIPGMSVVVWAEYYLDNFQTVDEAVRFTETKPIQLVPFVDPKRHREINLHLALEDATGDSAIIEYVGGILHVYHDRAYTVLTNSPTFDLQLENLKQYQGSGGDKPLPGTTLPADRFVRATYYTAHLPQGKTLREDLTGVLSVMQNISQPLGTPSPERPRISETLWRVVSDLSHRTYYYNSMSSFNIIWAQLDKFNLQPGGPVMKLDLEKNTDLAGDVSSYFKVVEFH